MDAIRSAQTSLGIAGRSSALVAGNVGRADEPGHVRRELRTTTDVTGARVARIHRAHHGALEAAATRAWSASEGTTERLALIARLRAPYGGADAASAPHARLAELRTAMQHYAADPSSAVAGEATVDRARDVANGLRIAATTIAEVRTDADAALGRAADELRGLLDAFGQRNAAVVAAERQGRDASDARDARDATLRSIAALVGVHARERAHGDVMLLAGTPGGPVLFETVPRAVGFAPSGTLTGTSAGRALAVDGVPLDGEAGGRVGAMLDVRDTIAPALATELDAVASEIVARFTDGGAPGLFVDPGGGPGAASRIEVAAAFDPDRGGDPTLLRDGVGRARNPGAAPGFADLLIERINAFEVGATSPLARASDHFGRLEATRSGASATDAAARAGRERAETARANALGVNVDEEMATLMNIERSYAAAARVIAVADGMLDDLLRLAGR